MCETDLEKQNYEIYILGQLGKFEYDWLLGDIRELLLIMVLVWRTFLLLNDKY